MKQSIAIYFESLSIVEQERALKLRSIILSTALGMQEELKWKIPFYSFYGPLCYINCQSGRLSLGFYRGAELMDESGILSSGELKQVRHIFFDSDKELPEAELKEIIFQAIELNQVKYSANSRGR